MAQRSTPSHEYPFQEAVSLAVDAATETLLGSAGGIGFKFVSVVAQRVQARKADLLYRAILESWARAADAPVAEFQEILWERAQDDSAFQDRLYDAFRLMAGARSDDSFPYIARLTAPYALADDLKPDEFFRRTARMLERCGSDDIRVLEGIFEVCESAIRRVRERCNADDSSPPTGVALSFNGANLTLQVSGRFGAETTEFDVTLNAELIPNAVSKAYDDAIVILGESRLAWYRSGVVSFHLQTEPAGPAGTLERLLHLFRRPQR